MKAADIPARWGLPWTDLEVARLRTMLRKDITRKEISKLLDRPKKGVVQKIRGLKLQRRLTGRPPVKLPDTATIEQLRLQGLSISSIARHYNCDRKTIAYRLGTWAPQKFPSYKWPKHA